MYLAKHRSYDNQERAIDMPNMMRTWLSRNAEGAEQVVARLWLREVEPLVATWGANCQGMH
jgi:hypothetical protein